jgi:maltose O-acetyltransferase
LPILFFCEEQNLKTQKQNKKMKIIKKILSRIRGEQNIKKLLKRGLKIGERVTIMSGVIIDPSHCWHIEIGNDVILAPHVHILAHDASTKIFLNHTRVANVKIGNKVFIGAGSIVLPGVTIGDNVVIGAGSIVTKNIPSDSLAVGNPAHIISSLTEFIQKQQQKMLTENTFPKEFTLRNKNFSLEQADRLRKASEKYGEIFVE